MDGLKERVSRIDGGKGAKKAPAGSGWGPVFDLFTEDEAG